MIILAFVAMGMTMSMMLAMRNRRIECMSETRPLHRFFVFLRGIGFSPAFTLQMKIGRRKQFAQSMATAIRAFGQRLLAHLL
jgi:hypothetical protein